MAKSKLFELKCGRVIRSRFFYFAQHDYIIQFIVRVWKWTIAQTANIYSIQIRWSERACWHTFAGNDGGRFENFGTSLLINETWKCSKHFFEHFLFQSCQMIWGRVFESGLNRVWNMFKKSCLAHDQMTKNQCTKLKWVDLSSLASHVDCGAFFFFTVLHAKAHQLIMSTNRAGDRKPFKPTTRFIRRHYRNSINDHDRSMQRIDNQRARERDGLIRSSVAFYKYSRVKRFLLKATTTKKTVFEMPQILQLKLRRKKMRKL